MLVALLTPNQISMKPYIYGGNESVHAFRGQPVVFAPGEIVQLTAEEAANVQACPEWAPQPTRQKTRRVTSDVTLTADDLGRRIDCDHTTPIEITLPTAPTLGAQIEIFIGRNATGDPVTVDPGPLKIDGLAGSITLTAAADSLSIFYNGLEWRTH